MLLENYLITLRRLLISRWCLLGLEEISMRFLYLLHLHLELVLKHQIVLILLHLLLYMVLHLLQLCEQLLSCRSILNNLLIWDYLHWLLLLHMLPFTIPTNFVIQSDILSRLDFVNAVVQFLSILHVHDELLMILKRTILHSY
jgi:hypothetical protein